MVSFVFSHPIYLWFFLVIPLLIFIHHVTIDYTKRRALKFANFPAIAKVTGGELLTSNNTLLILRIVIITCIILAVAGTTVWYKGKTNDYDFVLAIDASSSMLAEDFKPNRLEAAKDEAVKFLDSVVNVHVGVLSFSGSTFIEQELTDDMYNIKKAIENIEVKTLGGTNLGDAIVTSSNLLVKSDRSKMIILLTDGQSNVGVPLQEAVDYANKQHVVVNTVGIGTSKGGEFRDIGAISVLDEDSLRAIANNTEGNYYSAVDRESLAGVYKNIVSLTEKRIKKNLSPLLILFSLILLFLEWSLVNTKYKTIP